MASTSARDAAREARELHPLVRAPRRRSPSRARARPCRRSRSSCTAARRRSSRSGPRGRRRCSQSSRPWQMLSTYAIERRFSPSPTIGRLAVADHREEQRLPRRLARAVEPRRADDHRLESPAAFAALTISLGEHLRSCRSPCTDGTARTRRRRGRRSGCRRSASSTRRARSGARPRPSPRRAVRACPRR